MEIPNLILSIDEGLKKGETLERKPGASIRIGRILRGNTLAIKDPGISQKHLVVDFNSHISRWTATDLGASNGTSVNGLAIAPNAAFPLADGDTIKIGENTLMSVKISASSSAPEPRPRRGRRAASRGNVCPESCNVEVKRRMTTRASAKLEERIESGGKGVVMKGRRNVKALSVASSDTAVVMKEEERRGFEKTQVLVDDGSSKVSRKDDVLEPIKSDAKFLKRGIKKSSTFVARKDEEGQSLEKIQVLVNDGRRRRRGKKDDVLEAVVVEGKIRVHEVEDGELANSRGKRKGRRGGRSKRISRKDEEVLELAAPDLNSVCLKGEEEKKLVVKNSASDDGKKLSGSRKVMFRIEEVEDDKDGLMMSGQSNKEEESTKSWSSFSEIRGIPNTTSKYREV